MKTILNLTVVLIFVSLFASCSKEDINQDDNLLGVWETSISNTASVKTHTLVFGEDNTGLSIETNKVGSEMTSSAVPFNWVKSNKEVRLLDNGSTYTINAEGQLVSSTSSNLHFVKISKDYSKYY
ncbi:hypothetical protein [Aestuariivivens insulae]|uniref:hypothetical protein n=1 Tax=Aestuariivivens insulae TaxID=1621988 RepID=UPI001F5A3628|nr:hypothetical protein [Aestuariivivens insulae]